MKTYTVKIKALTPIWTGDAERKNTELRETGIIGSLRWWYEALIRGLGGNACDPASDKKCRLEEKKFKKALQNGKSVKEALSEQICPACQLFGCTGWSRKFRLEVGFNNTVPEVGIGTREKRDNLKRNVAGFMSDGTIILRFIPLIEITTNEWVVLNKTFKIIADYGALGARTSQGNGVIKIVENNLPHKDEKPKNFKLESKGNKINSPNLTNLFFYKFHIRFKKDISDLIKKQAFWTHSKDHNHFQDNWENWKKLWSDYHFLPIAFHIRDAIRHLENNQGKRHEIFGELGKGSKVFVSHGYEISDTTVEIRILGYDVGDDIKNKVRDTLENRLKEKLFSEEKYRESLENCTLTEEKTGRQILEELR